MKTKQISSRWVQEGSFLLHMHITYRCSSTKVSILQFAVHFETRIFKNATEEQQRTLAALCYYLVKIQP